MIWFAIGLFIGLLIAWLAVRRNDRMHRNILISISKGWGQPDDAGNMGWFRFPQNAEEEKKFLRSVEELRARA